MTIRRDITVTLLIKLLLLLALWYLCFANKIPKQYATMEWFFGASSQTLNNPQAIPLNSNKRKKYITHLREAKEDDTSD